MVVGARADARAGRARDRAPPGRRRPRRGARGPARRRRAARPAAAVRDRRRGGGARLRARGPAAAEATLEARSPTPASGGLVATAPPRAGRCCARWSTARTGTRSSSRRRAHRRSRATHGDVRAAASRSAAVGSLRRAFHEARCALEATSLANGDAPESPRHGPRRVHAAAVAPGRRGAAALQRRPAGADRADEGEYGGELLRSLEAFIEHNGNWERAARRALLPPAHAALPDPQGRGAHRPRPRRAPRPDRAVAGAAGEGARRMRVAVLRCRRGRSRRRSCATWPSRRRSPSSAARPRRGRARSGRGRRHGGGKARGVAPTPAPAARSRGLADALDGCDVLVNSASYRVNLDAMARASRRAATTSTSAGCTG